ncbi:HNH endonuclease [Pseudomonas gingeri]
MPTINNAVILSKESLVKIKKIKRNPDFSHQSWSSDELESVRSEIRDFYRNEQRLNCVFCLNPVSAKSALGAHVEHIAPKSLYPQFMFEPKNLCVVCPDCNEYKKNREVMVEKTIKTAAKRDYPQNKEKFRIYHPHYDDYNRNIKKAGFIYLENSPEGGYAIYVCNLNRFIHKFGISDELMKNFDLLLAAERFHGN